MLLLLLAATAWRLRQRPRRRSAWKYVPAAAAYALAVSIGGGGLSFSYSNGSVPPVLPFVQLGVGSGLLLLVARVWALPAGAPWGPRLLRALVLAGCAFVLSAFLLLGLNGPSLFRLGS
jgi:peptidoglycan/LPS O-acetylase OafA/YrhL